MKSTDHLNRHKGVGDISYSCSTLTCTTFQQNSLLPQQILHCNPCAQDHSYAPTSTPTLQASCLLWRTKTMSPPAKSKLTKNCQRKSQQFKLRIPSRTLQNTANKRKHGNSKKTHAKFKL